MDYNVALQHSVEDAKGILYAKSLIAAQLNEALQRIQDLEAENHKVNGELEALKKESQRFLKYKDALETLKVHEGFDPNEKKMLKHIAEKAVRLAVEALKEEADSK